VGEVKVWEVGTGQEVRTLKGHTGGVSSVAFSPDGKRLASACKRSADAQGKPLAGEVRVWDTATGQEVRTLKGHTGAVWSVAFSPDGQRLASAGGDYDLQQGRQLPGEVRVWAAGSGQ
jgi:WD40 repeat protein